MEPVHILGGHPIYEAMSEEEALKITQKWKADGGKHGTKPRFRFKLDNPTQDTGLYRFQEIEKDARRKSGFRFKPVDTLASSAAKYRGRLKKAGITQTELIKELQKEWSDAPKNEIKKLAEFFQKQEKIKKKELPLQRLELERLYGKKWAIDHAEAIASGEKFTDIFPNKRTIEDKINAFKSSKRGSLEYRAFLKEQGLDTAHNRVVRAFRSDVIYDKPGSGSIAWNKKMAEIWKPKSKVAQNITNYKKARIGGSIVGGLNVVDFLMPGEGSTQELRSVVQDGGSFKDAMKTYASEKKSEGIGIATTAPAFMAASKLPFVAPALKVAAPAFALTALVSAVDKADDIFLDGKYKEFSNKYGPAISEGKQMTSIPGDFDYNKRGQI